MGLLGERIVYMDEPFKFHFSKQFLKKDPTHHPPEYLLIQSPQRGIIYSTWEMHMGALSKLTSTHLKFWTLRSPLERDSMEVTQSHLSMYFTGITPAWKHFPASQCCWVKINPISISISHTPHSIFHGLLCVYMHPPAG